MLRGSPAPPCGNVVVPPLSLLIVRCVRKFRAAEDDDDDDDDDE